VIGVFVSYPKFRNALRLSALSLALTACASLQQAPSVDKVAIEKSKIYLDAVEVVQASSTLAVCAVPPGLENAYSSGKGASPQWKDLLARASKCAYEKNWATLETIAQTMSRLDIDSPWGPYFMSVVANEYGNQARAHWMIDLAEKKAGTKLGLFAYQRGRIYLQSAKTAQHPETSKAMDEFEKAVALDPKLVDASIYLAGVHYRDHEWKEAAAQYSLVLAQKPGFYQALVGMAESKFHMGDSKAAASFYAKAIEADGHQLQPWIRTAEIYESLKDTELALATYRDLRHAIDTGSVKQRPEFDLGAKIKTMESVVHPPERAQASVKEVDAKRSKK
jgi:tetratricopeptide (TPR) repeat protein